jgi:hypothetical protein
MTDKDGISNATATPADADGDLGSFVTVPVAGDAAAAIADMVASGVGGEALVFDSANIEDQMVLSLADLLPDSRGDVVLFNEAGPLSVNIMADSPVTESGTADHYVTSAGVDVTGYHFCTFDSGLTIYYPSEIDLLVTAGQV